MDGELESVDDHGGDEGGESEQGVGKTDGGSKVLRGVGATLPNESGGSDGGADGDLICRPVDGEETPGVCDGPSGFDAIGQFTLSVT